MGHSSLGEEGLEGVARAQVEGKVQGAEVVGEGRNLVSCGEGTLVLLGRQGEVVGGGQARRMTAAVWKQELVAKAGHLPCRAVQAEPAV